MNNAVCSATITLEQHHHQNYAAGICHKSALISIIITRQQDLALRLPNVFTLHSPPHHHLRFSKNEIRTAGSGHKTVNRTWQTAIWHRSRETAILTMLTTNQRSLIYLFYCLPSPTILLKIWYNRGGHKSA
jgi:hypothetical protein